MEQMMNSTEIMLDPNLAYLDAEMRILRLRLEELAEGGVGSSLDAQDARDSEEIRHLKEFLTALASESETRGWRLEPPRIRKAFQLSSFEYQLLLLAVAPDLDGGLGERIAKVQKTRASWPSAGLAWRLFCPTTQEVISSRDSLRQDAPLLRFHLLQPTGSDATLPELQFQIDRRIADALVGRSMPDARITPLVRIHPVANAEAVLPPSHQQLACRLSDYLKDCLSPKGPKSLPLVVELHGAPEADLELFAAEVARGLGVPLLAASADELPQQLSVEFIRESLLVPCLLLLGGINPSKAEGRAWMQALTDGATVAFVANQQPLSRPSVLGATCWLPVALPPLDAQGRSDLWNAVLEAAGLPPGRAAYELAEDFDLSANEIKQATKSAMQQADLRGAALNWKDVVTACRAESQHRMGDLAQRLEPLYTWEDLILPPEATAKLQELCAQVRCRQKVLHQFDFASRLTRGRGVTGLFAGPSGTGKTMAAEVIAQDLNRELYRVDLARVVSKYIGETEKNLREIFHEAERARCVVLFDEADALFGRRTEVRDSHDRYANIEVSYLLQLLEETESAVVLLATNRREAIDEAFMRRFRFLVDFPLPDRGLRQRLWERSFPARVPIAGVHFDTLAERLPLSGASIRNIALAAAYLAASDGGVVGPRQIALGARRELEKLGRPAPFSEADIRAPGTREAKRA